MSNSMKFLITFRKRFRDPVEVKAYANSFFKYTLTNSLPSEYTDYIANFTEPKIINIDNVYEIDLYDMATTLQYFAPQAYGNIFSKIISLWCDPKSNNISELWLQIAEPSILENSGKLLHSDVEIKEIAFGTFPDMQHFMQHYHYKVMSNEKEIMSTFLHSQRKLMIFTCFKHLEDCSKRYVHNKFEFSYQSIFRIIVSYFPDTDFVHIFFHLHHTPLLFVKKMNESNYEQDNSNISFLESDQEYQTKTWDRTLDFGCDCKHFHCGVHRIGQCPVMKIVLPLKHKTYDIIERLIQRCPSSTTIYFAEVKTEFPVFQESLKDFGLFPFNDQKLEMLVSDQYSIGNIKFKCQYAWEVVNCKSLEVKDQISMKFKIDPKSNHWESLKRKLMSYFDIKMNPFDRSKTCEVIGKKTDAICNTLYDISEMINRNLIFTFEDAFTILFDHHIKSVDKEEIPDGMRLIRRIILTPSKLILLPPSEHFDNRVIREYGGEHLLRVSIQDDNFKKLTFAVQFNSKKHEFLARVVKRILLSGIYIGPRGYDVLAASNSQLREHGLWMFAKDKQGHTAESIRKWMGNFDHIKNVAKYMARMGQCFSTSDESVQIELEEDEVVKLPDVKTKDGKYIFSDGVGMMSEDLAQEVRNAFAKRNNLNETDDIYDPSAFQIRFKGCKGMLVESRTIMPKCGRMIGIRDSMEKFPCPSSNMLEVVKISAPRAVFLNRPLITILENLGVKKSIFLELQKKMVFDLTDSLIYEKKALKILKNCTSLCFPFKKLSDSGIYLTTESFFRSLLLSVYRSLIGNLKHKARIAVPPKYGRNMLGVMDETKTLEYGQIFVQYSKQVGLIKSQTKILEGTVVVTKNPCMHPGDVRKLQAINVDALHHIKDCIVFPAQGKRPHPDEMAGSDLDGDEYVVIWDPSLIFPYDNCDAMDYPANKEDTLHRPIEVHDMINFLSNYIQTDNVGLMANAYLAWADYNQDGIFSNVCKSIAQKYPQALDFAKSGTTQYLTSSERPHNYPDFMEKGCQNNNYKSEKTLGLLYRVIRNLEASVSSIKNTVSALPDPYLEYCGWEEFEDIAKSRRKQYSKRVQSILVKYGLKDETEALTGYISEINDFDKNKYDSENVSLLAKKYLYDTIKRYQLKFSNDCEQKHINNPHLRKKDVKYMMASAWYMVTYQDSNASILSFPWVVSEYLCELREKNVKSRKLVTNSLFNDSLDTFLLNEFKYQIKTEETVQQCDCVLIFHYTMLDWVKKSSFILTTSSEDVFCLDCFNRILSHFTAAKMLCCSFAEDSCNCSIKCSPMKMILESFKYYASEIIDDLGVCRKKLQTGAICEGFRDFNLQSLALKTYAVIAVSQSMQYLGFVKNSTDDVYSDTIEEGNPIRIRVTKEYEEILTGRVDEVCEVLKDLSGVKRVFIDGISERNHFYLLIQSIGKAFSRWNLEELIMDSKCPTILRSRLNMS